MSKKELNQNKSTNNKENKEDRQKDLINDPTRTIFLQNVNYSCTVTEIQSFFEKFGEVEYCKICKSKLSPD